MSATATSTQTYPAPTAGRTKSAARTLGIVRRDHAPGSATVLTAEQNVAVERILFQTQRVLDSYPDLDGLRPEQVARVVALLTDDQS